MQNRAMQHGAALFTALIMLVVLTLLGLASLGTSLLELRMSGNEEMAMSAYQLAESGAEAILADALAKEPKIVIAAGKKGDTSCFNSPDTCSFTIDKDGLPPPVNTKDFHIKITQTTDCTTPPSSGRYATSAKHFYAATFETESLLDKSYKREGKATVTQGFMKLLPGGPGGCAGLPPQPVQDN